MARIRDPHSIRVSMRRILTFHVDNEGVAARDSDSWSWELVIDAEDVDGMPVRCGNEVVDCEVILDHSSRDQSSYE